jgi:hypothetical protein
MAACYEYNLLRTDALAVTPLPLQLNGGIELPEHFAYPGLAADYGMLAAQDARFGCTVGWHQCCGDVAAADVFGQRGGHGLWQAGEQRIGFSHRGSSARRS